MLIFAKRERIVRVSKASRQSFSWLISAVSARLRGYGNPRQIHPGAWLAARWSHGQDSLRADGCGNIGSDQQMTSVATGLDEAGLSLIEHTVAHRAARERGPAAFFEADFPEWLK